MLSSGLQLEEHQRYQLREGNSPSTPVLLCAFSLSDHLRQERSAGWRGLQVLFFAERNHINGSKNICFTSAVGTRFSSGLWFASS